MKQLEINDGKRDRLDMTLAQQSSIMAWFKVTQEATVSVLRSEPESQMTGHHTAEALSRVGRNSSKVI
jgi:hypothetical protein